MRFELDVSSDSHCLVYGFDSSVGWFGELTQDDEKTIMSYDKMTYEYDHERPVRGLLLFISESTDLFDEADLNEALERLIHEGPEELPDHLQVVGEIVNNLKVAAERG